MIGKTTLVATAQMGIVHVGVKIPDPLYEKLADHAQQTSLSKSEVILSALAQYLNSTENVPLVARFKKLEKRVTHLEVIAKISK